LADPALAATLRNTEQITANLNTTTTELNRMVKNDLPQIAGNLTTITDNMSLISNNLKDIDYARTFSSIDSTLRNVKMLTDKLSSTDNTIGLFLNDPSLYQNLNATSINAASLLNDLKEHPKKYVHFSIFGRKEKTKE
jgi:phospholipid/cholesterol/gamma-HCH transport system substrate-binding protein